MKWNQCTLVLQAADVCFLTKHAQFGIMVDWTLNGALCNIKDEGDIGKGSCCRIWICQPFIGVDLIQRLVERLYSLRE